MEFDGIDAMPKPIRALQDRLVLNGEIGMFLPLGSPAAAPRTEARPVTQPASGGASVLAQAPRRSRNRLPASSWATVMHSSG